MPNLTFHRFDSSSARAIRDTIALIHRDAYVERINSGDPFYTSDAFMQRFDAYTSREGFDLVVASLGDVPVGQAWGWALGPDTAWWQWLVDDVAPEFIVDPEFIKEDGKRTFALSEIMVRQAYTGQGIAHALHDELLGGRHETRATLLVNPINQNAYRIYLRWGWEKVAYMRPNWSDAPLFDVLILPLPITRPGCE